MSFQRLCTNASFWRKILSSNAMWKNETFSLNRKNISSNQLFSNFFSKTLLSQNFSPKCVRLNRSSSRSKIRRFHEKNRQIEDSFAESLFWRVFFRENEFSFLRASFWRIFFYITALFSRKIVCFGIKKYHFWFL